MCGLVGAAGKLEESDLAALAFLGTLSSLRGDDSTGLMDFVPTAKVATKYSKTTEMPESFFKPDGVYSNTYCRSRYKKTMPTAVAVHTRFATVGNVTKANSHPFVHGNIIGMHNGTIKSDKLENKAKFGTDSEALYYNLSVKGLDYLYDLERMFDAAYALVWINAKEGSLNMLRNTQRPLWVLTTHDKKKVFWASDPKWLDAVLPYFGVKGQYINLPIDTLHTMRLAVKDPVESIRTMRYVKPYNGSHLPSTTSVSRPPSSDEEKARLAAITNKHAIGTHIYDKDKSWCKSAARWMTQAEEDRYWELVQQEMVAAKKAEDKNNVVPFVTKDTEDERGEDEQARLRFLDDEPNRVCAGKDGVYYYNTYSHVYANSKFYRRILSGGCRGCDTPIKVTDDVLFLNERDFLCETCRDDKLVLNMVREEVEDEAWNKVLSPNWAIQPDSDNGEEEWGVDEGKLATLNNDEVAEDPAEDDDNQQVMVN